LRMDVRQRLEQLIEIELDFQGRHDRLHLVKVAGGPQDGPLSACRCSYIEVACA
jgi:hypothetical protein